MIDEIYDIFDRAGTHIGTATWTDCHTKGLIHKTVACLIFKDASKQEVLLQRRSMRMAQQPGKLQHSAGGHVLAGMSMDEGMRQELQEELFLDRSLPAIKIKEVTVSFQNDLPNNYEFITIYEIIYPGPFFFNPKEVAEEPVLIKWFDLLNDIKNSPEKFAPSFLHIMKAYIKAVESKMYDKTCLV